MNLDEIEDLIRRYLSAGVAVVIILVAPSTGGTSDDPVGEPGGDPTVVTVDPERPADPEPRTVSPRTVGPRPSEDSDTTDSDTTDDDTTDDDTADDDTRPAPDDEDPTPTRTRPPEPDDDPAADEPSNRQDPDDEEPDTEDTDTEDTDTEDTEESDPEESDQDRSDDDADDTDLDARGPADDSEPGIDDPDDAESDTDAEDRSADDDTPTTTAPRTTTAGPAEPGSAPASEGPTAAERLGWGAPVQEDDFTSADLRDWEIYDGPGHAGEGVRSSRAITVEDGVLTITGDAEGTTGGMAWGGGQQYGRWEGRVRAPAADPTYNALLLLWPDAENWPVGGEIDFMEMLDPTRQQTDFFLHFGENDDQITSQVEIDATEWHNWAVEWTPEAITGYVDGEEWFRSTDPTTFPPGPMHLCIQLDWFPEGSAQVQESTMEVEWVRQYALDDTAATPTRDRAVTEPAGSPVTEILETDPLVGMFSWG